MTTLPNQLHPAYPFLDCRHYYYYYYYYYYFDRLVGLVVSMSDY